MGWTRALAVKILRSSWSGDIFWGEEVNHKYLQMDWMDIVKKNKKPRMMLRFEAQTTDGARRLLSPQADGESLRSGEDSWSMFDEEISNGWLTTMHLECGGAVWLENK